MSNPSTPRSVALSNLKSDALRLLCNAATLPEPIPHTLIALIGDIVDLLDSAESEESHRAQWAPSRVTPSPAPEAGT